MSFFFYFVLEGTYAKTTYTKTLNYGNKTRRYYNKLHFRCVFLLRDCDIILLARE